MLFPLMVIATLAAPASAAKLPDCIHVSSMTILYKADLNEVRDCQNKARRKMIIAAQAKGKPLSSLQLEQIDDQLRVQVRDFLAHSTAIIEGETKSDSLTKQRFSCPDIKYLLDLLVRNGGKLTPEMLMNLQSAVRAGKSLNIDMDTGKKPRRPADPWQTP